MQVISPPVNILYLLYMPHDAILAAAEERLSVRSDFRKTRTKYLTTILSRMFVLVHYFEYSTQQQTNYKSERAKRLELSTYYTFSDDLYTESFSFSDFRSTPFCSISSNTDTAIATTTQKKVVKTHITRKPVGSSSL